MRLLICTQKVDKNDPILGFFHGWIIEFSKHMESVIVVCLQKGECDLPSNVRVLSLGKENKSSRFRYLWNFYSYIWAERKKYDKVFVHMNPIYVILGWKMWWFLGKKISLWYTHKNVDLKLWIAEKFVTRVFTASPESFRLKSRKVHVVGHGIDTDIFTPAKIPVTDIVVVSVSRISETKNQMLMVKAFELLKNNGSKAKLIISGGPVTPADRAYDEEVRVYIKEHNLSRLVECAGPVIPSLIPDTYRAGNIFLNLSSTGSLDKAVLEAMSCGLYVLTSNDAFKAMIAPEHMTSASVPEMTERIMSVGIPAIDADARAYVVQHHSLGRLITNLSNMI